ncbi:hypothetical protein EPN90_01480 [Patescibacteria group bacterium]|nr:MAG: hypothetical protein EPN90_01480 [Patescibacteria group bacterium]
MQLEDFLVKAKINTYASVGEGGERKLDDGGKEFVYEEGEWKYRDRYFGFSPFIGEEVVWKDGKVIWAMNYYGRVLSEKVSPEEIYQFLKKILRQVRAERPYRGPRQFKEGDFSYKNSNHGALEDFEGLEIILYQGSRIYELRYIGGIVK